MNEKQPTVNSIIYARIPTPPRGFEDDRWDHQVDSCEDYATRHGFTVVDVMQDYGSHLDHLGRAFGYIAKHARHYEATKLVVLNYDALVRGDSFRLYWLLWSLEHHHGLQVVPVVGKAITRETDPCYAALAVFFDEVARKQNAHE
ncbi:MAG TPA: hypothetical protein VNM40_01555 [Candidatus Paceibacterota bacterium]|nr:hypothetical protein [Candidatus Paceibacterota bacterium]